MAYGLKYSCTFDRVDSTGDTYTIQILQNNYGGGVTYITGSSNPVTHTWETDDPKAPIKGSSLAITLVNEGTIPLTDLYSTDDQEFKATLTLNLFGGGTILLFEGFIVQDDSSELMVDYNHEITLSANDNLGLLKDIPFDKSLAQPLYLVESITDTVDGQAPNFVLVSVTTYDKLFPGDTIVITSTGGVNGTFTIASKQVITGSYYLIFNEAVANLPATSSTIEIYMPDMLSLRPLLSFVKSCLLSTGLQLVTRVFANINESTQTNTVCFLEQTLIDPQTFYNGSSWDDCYQVLEKILTRFNATLFQAKGYWNIVRWDEARYYDYAVPGFIYDADFAPMAAQALDESNLIFAGYPKYLIGIGESSVAENGLLNRINRPLKFVKETFSYQKPEEILKNHNLQNLGEKFDDITTGTVRREYYRLPVSSAWTHIATDDSYIVVETDTVTLNEIQRYVEQPVYDSAYPPAGAAPVTSLEFNDIEVGQGDAWDLSFSYRWQHDGADLGLLNVAIFVMDSATDGYNLNDPGLTGGTHLVWGHITGTYTDGFGNRVSTTIIGSDDLSEWRQFSISGLITDPAYKMVNIPVDGVMKIYVYGSNSRDGGQQSGYVNEAMEFKDINFEYTPLINQSTKITGHTHTSEQNLVIKNVEEKEIYLDSAPRNSLKGSLFLNSLTGLLQTRAGQWKRSYIAGDKNLGEITTFENLFLRRIPRTLLEGTFHGLLSAGNQLSPLSVIQYTFFTDLNFIFGRLEIDYRNNSASGTLYELYKGIETDLDLSYFYLFQYLYAAK